MKRKNFCLYVFFYSIVIAAVFTSCKKDEKEEDVVEPDYTAGAIITNEGSFGSSNGSVSYYDYSANKMTNGLFETVNGRPLGDVVQSIAKFGDNSYIVVNGSNKIEVVTTKSFKEVGVITDLNSPRYMVGVSSSKAYVSQWGDNGVVKVINLANNTVSKSINVNTGPEKMAKVGDYVYVVNGGGWGTDSVVSVINTLTDEVETSIQVGISPMDIVVDNDNNIWVMCKGSVTYDSLWNPVAHVAATLVKINSSTKTVENTVTISANSHPEQLEISPDGSTLYYGAGMGGFHGIYRIIISTMELSATPLIDKTFYGFAVRAVDGVIYGLDAGDYQTNGTLYRYSATGTELGSVGAGLIPNGAWF